MNVVGVLLTGVAGLGFALITVNLHEHGHWLVGRVLGIPRADITVDLSARPPHVALRHGETWLAPATKAAWRRSSVIGPAPPPPGCSSLAASPSRPWLRWRPSCCSPPSALGARDGKGVGVVLRSSTPSTWRFNAVVSVWRGHTYGDAASLWQIRIGGTIAFLLAAAATKAAAIVLAS